MKKSHFYPALLRDLLQILLAKQKNLTLFIEYPCYLPNVTLAAARNASYYERMVISSDAFTIPSKNSFLSSNIYLLFFLIIYLLFCAEGTLLMQNGAWVLDVQADDHPDFFEVNISQKKN